MSKADDGGGSTKADNISKAKRERGELMIPSEVAPNEFQLSHKTSSMHSLVLLRVKLGDALVKCKKEDE